VRLYHGTNKYFESFENRYINTSTSIDQYGSGFYFYGNKGSTILHGDLRVYANVEILKCIQYDDKLELSLDDIESLILKSSDLEYYLSNFDDIDYYGFDKVFKDASKLYIGGHFLDTLNKIGNDFFPDDYHILLSEFVKLTGINCIKDSKRDIFVILDKKYITIEKVVHEQDDE
jgi:hypothetical protein